MKRSQSPSASPVKNGRASRSKLRGASLLTDHAWLEISRTLGITKRELQIVQAVFDNKHEADTAKRFKLSPHTVHMHLNRLFKKLNVTSRTELVLRIVEQMVALTLSETAVLPPICPHQHTGDCRMHNPPAPSQTRNTSSSYATIHSASHVG